MRAGRTVAEPEYDLVWWQRKALPHRYGQKCRWARSAEREDWMPKDHWRFEFEDGTYEWGPRRGARRPNREFRADLEHRNPECTGEWRKGAGGYVCFRCETWVRITPETNAAFASAERMEWDIRYNVQAAEWNELFEKHRQESDEALAARLVRLDPGLAWTQGFIRSMEDQGFEITTHWGTKIGRKRRPQAM